MIDDVGPGTALVLRRYFTVLVLVFVILAVIGGYAAYGAYAGEEYRAQREVTATWTPETSFDHSATVRNDSIVFDEGEVLANRSVYFSQVAPELDGTYVVSHDGDADKATVTVDLTMELRAVEERGGKTIVHWRETEPIATASVDGLESGTRHEIPFTVPVTTLDQRLEDIEDELGASPGRTEVVVTAETSIKAEAGGESFVDARTDTLEFVVGGSTYAVNAALEDEQPYEATNRVEKPVEPSSLARYGGPLLVLGAIGGLAGLGWIRHRGSLEIEPETRARIEYQQARTDFDDWISAGTVPERDHRTIVTVESLEAIADVAIDTDRRVIEVDGPRYVVLVEGVRYVYEPPAAVTAHRGTERPNEPADTNAHPGGESDADPEEWKHIGRSADDDGSNTDTTADADEWTFDEIDGKSTVDSDHGTERDAADRDAEPDAVSDEWEFNEPLAADGTENESNTRDRETG